MNMKTSTETDVVIEAQEYIRNNIFPYNLVEGQTVLRHLEALIARVRTLEEQAQVWLEAVGRPSDRGLKVEGVVTPNMQDASPRG